MNEEKIVYSLEFTRNVGPGSPGFVRVSTSSNPQYMRDVRYASSEFQEIEHNQNVVAFSRQFNRKGNKKRFTCENDDIWSDQVRR